VIDWFGLVWLGWLVALRYVWNHLSCMLKQARHRKTHAPGTPFPPHLVVVQPHRLRLGAAVDRTPRGGDRARDVLVAAALLGGDRVDCLHELVVGDLAGALRLDLGGELGFGWCGVIGAV